MQKGIKYEQFQYWKKRIKRLNAQIADQAKNPCRQGVAPSATWMEIPTGAAPDLIKYLDKKKHFVFPMSQSAGILSV